MKKYEVWSSMGNKSTGVVVTVDDEQVIVSQEGDHEDELMTEAIAWKQTLEDAVARTKMIMFVPVDNDKDPAAEPDADGDEGGLAKLLAEAKARPRRSRPGDIVRKAIEEESEIEFTGTGLISKADEERR